MPNKEYWDKLWDKSPLTEEEVEEYGNQYLAPELLRCLDRYCGSGQISWLEAGCGPGYWNFLFNGDKRIRLSVGVDISDCLVEAQRYKQEHNLGALHFIKADLPRLPFKAESFNFITSLGVIEHFSRPQVPLLEMKRVLKPGGILFLDTPNKGIWGLRTKYFPLDEHEDYYRPEELRAMANECGLEVLDCYAKGFSNAVMTVLYQIYDYNRHSILSRGYHFVLSYVKRMLKIFDPWLDRKYGFYSIVIACKR
jgi:ubiquinone/menaquinone biosynthesis C-methylase UbiE